MHHPILLTHLEDWLPDRRKIEFIEHGNYIGYYAAETSPEEARAALGLRTEDLVISVLGQIRPYKDLHRLLPIINAAMRANHRLKLVVAGKINCEKTLNELALLPKNQILIKNEFIDDNEIQTYIKAASFVMLSYRDILTSGSLFQAFGFGVPVIAPELGSIPAYVVDGWNGFFYKSSNYLQKYFANSTDLTQETEKRMARNAHKSARALAWPGLAWP